MKIINRMLFFCMLLLFHFGYSQDNFDIVGKWIANDFWENKSEMIFSDDKYISMTINGEFLEGKNFIIKGGKNNGQKGELKYEIDYSNNPYFIDIIAYKSEDDKLIEKGRIVGILKVINKNEILLILSIDGVRDKNFDDPNKEKTLVLKR